MSETEPTHGLWLLADEHRNARWITVDDLAQIHPMAAVTWDRDGISEMIEEGSRPWVDAFRLRLSAWIGFNVIAAFGPRDRECAALLVADPVLHWRIIDGARANIDAVRAAPAPLLYPPAYLSNVIDDGNTLTITIEPTGASWG